MQLLFALSYAIFFRYDVASDVYGLIITVATFAVMKKFRLEGMAKTAGKYVLYCGISTIFWGNVWRIFRRYGLSYCKDLL